MKIALALALLLLPLANGGCIAMAREVYSSPRAPGAKPVLPSNRVFIETDYPQGRVLRRSASAIVFPLELGGEIELLICNARESLAFFIFPPLPPLVSQDLADFDEPPLVVLLEVRGPGKWTIDPRAVTLVTEESARLQAGLKMPPLPFGEATNLCSCFDSAFEAAPVEPIQGTGSARAWLGFAIGSSPHREHRLELGGIWRDGVPVAVPPVELRPGARWFWYPWVP